MKLYKRTVVDYMLRFLESQEALVIYGARQVGKTSLLKYLMENHLGKNVFYMDLELPHLLALCEQSPEAVYSYLLQRGLDENKRIVLLIDEIQYMADPTRFLKIMHDHFSNVKLIVSGSSTFEVRKKLTQSLAGRTVNVELYPLSFEEFLVFKEKVYRLTGENSQTVNEELIPLAEEYIRFGGFPRIVLEPSEEKKQAYLGQLISTYVRKDIRDLGKIRDISSFNRLLELLASQASQILNILEISNTLGISRLTVTEYLTLLENTFIIATVAPYHHNLRSEISKNHKVFFLDTGMMHLLWLKEFPKVVLGSSFETFVFLELLKARKRINFWRTTNRQEVDFIVVAKNLYAIEAKLNFQNADSKALKFFSDKYGSKIVTVGLKGKRKGRYVWELVKELG